MIIIKKKLFIIEGIIIALSLFVITLLPVNAYYNPGKPTGFVNDYVRILSLEEKQFLEDKLATFEKKSSNEIVIVIIDTLQGDTIENFAVKLFEDWKIGKKNKDNGILILVAKSDRQVRIEVGYGLEGVLTDSQAYWIIQNKIKPAFKDNNFYLGLNQAIDAIIFLTQKEYQSDDSANNNFFGVGIEPFIFLGFIVFQILIAVMASSKSWWLGGVVGAVIGFIAWFMIGWLSGLVLILILTPLGLLFDYLASNSYQKAKAKGRYPWWYGGFGGFGGGGSGGGGSSGNW